MKIRALHLNNIRDFRGEYTLDFVDEFTNEPRPLTVLSGSNGCGKTTVLEAIGDIFCMPTAKMLTTTPLIREAQEGGWICAEIEVSNTGEDPPDSGGIPPRIHLGAGNQDLLLGGGKDRWADGIFATSGMWPSRPVSAPVERLLTTLARIAQDRIEPRTGLLYFPSTRQLQGTQGGPIEPPLHEAAWVETVATAGPWNGGLEQYWVWQNYLDLEAGRPDRLSLRPYVERIERLLGDDRRIFIQQGRVYVTQRNPDRPPVRIHELPSGEQQILLLMGELARHAYPGLVCLIDEPEISLHPALQHTLAHALRQFAHENDSQFILATHSPEIVAALPGATLFLDRLVARHTVADPVAQAA